MGANARVPAPGRARRLGVVEESREQAGEEERAEGEVEDEDVVDEAVVFEAEELRRGRDCDGQAHPVTDPDHDGPHVERSRHRRGHYNVTNCH